MPRLYEFGSFRLDGVRRVLLRDNLTVPLTAKALSLLLILVEHQGETLSKQALLNSVWAGSVVEENTLTRTVSMLRKALGEIPGQHEYIVTEPGLGYRFVAPLREVLSTQVALSGSTRIRRSVGVLAVCVVTAAGVGLILSLRRPGHAYLPARLTNHGRVVKAGLSPDGSTVVFASGLESRESLVMLNVADHKTTEVVPADAVHYLGLTFSPVAPVLYAVAKGHQAPAVLSSIDLRTGRRQRIVENLDSPVSFSPDGEEFAFIRPHHSDQESTLMIGNLAGSVQRLAGRRLPEWIDYPAWSPDGKVIACTLVGGTGGKVGVLAIDAESGKARLITSRTWGYIVQLSWLDRHSIVFSAREADSEVYRLWRLSTRSGEAAPITDDLSYLEGASSSRDASRIISVQQQLLSAIWLIGSQSERQQVTVDSPSHPNAARLTSTAMLVEQAETHGRFNLESINIDGTGRRQLSNSGVNSNASVCPDGSIVLVSDRDGTPGIWRTRPDGTNWTRVVPTTGHTVPRCSPDSKWIVYSIIGGGQWPTVRRATLEGGQPTTLSAGRCDYPSISPDGRYVACFWAATDSAVSVGPPELAVIPSGGGDPVRVFPLAQSVHYHAGTEWSPDGTSVLYVGYQGGVARIWKQGLREETPSPLDVVQAAEIFHFHLYPDGQWIFSIGRKSSDIVMFTKQYQSNR